MGPREAQREAMDEGWSGRSLALSLRRRSRRRPREENRHQAAPYPSMCRVSGHPLCTGQCSRHTDRGVSGTEARPL